MVSSEEVKKYMLESDIYVMTSLTECFPMVLLEASGVGLPLISFDVPTGPRAIINNGENGYLIKNRNIDEMAEKIISLLKNRDKMKNMQEKSYENAKKYLSENIMKKWYNIFDN
jgi:glycosyltransferase involved in cell wall biosynthesis